MKKLLLIALAITTIGCIPTRTTSREVFVKTETLKDLKENKADLYVKANDWMVDVFKSPESVIEFTDRESGTILGKYLAHGTPAGEYTPDTRIFAKIDVRVKDNSAKIEISPMDDVKTFSKAHEQSIQDNLDLLILSFISHMTTDEKDW